MFANVTGKGRSYSQVQWLSIEGKSHILRKMKQIFHTILERYKTILVPVAPRYVTDRNIEIVITRSGDEEDRGQDPAVACW